MATIAQRINEALGIRHMKQADLVRLTGIGKSSISTYISGEYEPKQRNIYKLALVLNVSEAWLMGYDVPMERSSGDALYNAAKAAVYNQAFYTLSDKEKERALNSVSPPALTAKDKRDVAQDVEEIMENLSHSGQLMFDGVPMSEAARAAMAAAMRVGLEEARRQNKETYTPKKYRKE